MPLGSDPKSFACRPEDKSRLLGQILTPSEIAHSMAERLLDNRPERSISILDPAVGPGTFLNALQNTGLLKKNDEMVMFDIDEDMVNLAKSQIKNNIINSTLINEDYLDHKSEKFYDFAIMNPPYVRQEWIDKKTHYIKAFKTIYGLDIPGTSNLYVYFLAKVLHELKPGGKMVFIIYDTWQFTKFGKWIRSIIDANCDLVSAIPIKLQPFHGHLIDANVFLVRRAEAEFKSGLLSQKDQMIYNPISPLSNIAQFKTISELFHTKRGLRLKQADFFLCDFDKGKRIGATPFVKKSSQIKGYFVPEDHNESALLIPLETSDPIVLQELMNRLAMAQQNPEDNVSVLTWYRERPDTWYTHRKASYAPIIFNYYLRNKPRHILNPDRAYSDNFYGLTPKFDVDPLVLLAIMNSTCVCTEILSHARNQGNGLAKIQLFEYRDVRVPDYRVLNKNTLFQLKIKGEELLAHTANNSFEIRKAIDEILESGFAELGIKTKVLHKFYDDWNKRIKVL